MGIASKLRKRITIQQPAEVQNVYGEPGVTWQTFKDVRAAVEPLRGREFWAAREQQARVTTRMRIRYLAGVTPKMRVLFESRTYLIVAVIDPNEAHQEMQLMCEELVAT